MFRENCLVPFWYKSSVLVLIFHFGAIISIMNVKKLQFHFVVVGITDKTNAVVLKRVRFAGENSWFGFPENSQLLSAHDKLVDCKIIKNSIASLKTRGSFRNVLVTVPEETYKLYVDDDGNFVFNDFYLGEVVSVSPNPQSGVDSSSLKVDSMVACLEQLASPREESIKEILKHILLEKFSSKNKNVESWCDRFEKELHRFKLVGRRQIELLKSCLEPGLNNWFIVTQENLAAEADWSLWREELISNFGDSSFRPICSAIGYKYIGGSYVDYAINKEKLLVEVNRNYSKAVILDLIVYGLPAHIVKSLNTNKITTLQSLKKKLKKYEGGEKFSEENSRVKFNFNKDKSNSSSSFHSFDDKKNSTVKNNVNNNSGKRQSFNRKPCSLCTAKGFSGRLHAESVCWYRDKAEMPSKNVNNVEYESSSNLSDEEVQKN